jgi:hypothetical protein
VKDEFSERFFVESLEAEMFTIRLWMELFVFRKPAASSYRLSGESGSGTYTRGQPHKVRKKLLYENLE